MSPVDDIVDRTRTQVGLLPPPPPKSLKKLRASGHQSRAEIQTETRGIDLCSQRGKLEGTLTQCESGSSGFRVSERGLFAILGIQLFFRRASKLDAQTAFEDWEILHRMFCLR